MAKTRRLIEQNASMVDIVLELCDARIPISSRNPILSEILGSKPRLLIFNKSDMADPEVNEDWIGAAKGDGLSALCCDAMGGSGVDRIPAMIRSILKERIERDAQKGMTRIIRAMVVGIPNVGKSSLINRLTGKKIAKVEDRPGVTRAKQWIHVPGGLDLLDTPGILWPKFDDEQTGLHLAFTGAIKDDVLDVEEVACELLSILARRYPECITERYDVPDPQILSGYDLLEAVGRRRGCVISGGEINTERAAAIILDEYRAGKLGRITLEYPKGNEDDGLRTI